MIGRGVQYGVRRAQLDGTLWLPGGICMRISSGAAGAVLPFPILGVFDDGVQTQVVFLDNGPTPLITEKIDGSRQFPPIVLAGLTPGLAVAFVVAKTDEAAKLLAAGGQIATDASGRVVVIGAETDNTAALGPGLIVSGFDGTLAHRLLTDTLGQLLVEAANSQRATYAYVSTALGIGINSAGSNALWTLEAPAGSAIRIRRIRVYYLSMTATAASFQRWFLQHTNAAATGGTDQTAGTVGLHDVGDGAFGGKVRDGAGGNLVVTGNGNQIDAFPVFIPAAVLAAPQPPIYDRDFDKPGCKPLIIPAGVANGIALGQSGPPAGAAGAFILQVVFTVGA